MALATAADVERRLGRSLTTDELAKTPGLLDEASVLIVGHLGATPEQSGYDETPDAIVIVTSRMVARVIQQSAMGTPALGATQVGVTAGPFSQQTSFQAGATSGAPWIDAKDKIALRPYRSGGGMRSVGLATSQSGTYGATHTVNGD